MTGAAPTISVIVASTTPLPEAPACLASLVRGAGPRPTEVILAHGADREPPPEWTVHYPEVTLLRPPPPTTLPALLGAAISQAKGEIIGIVDARCGLDDGWVAAALRAHDAPHPVIGGAVEPGPLRGAVEWAAYLCDYGAFMRPLGPGRARHVPGINVTLKRWALARGREFVEGEFWKSYWCRRLQAEGIDLVVDPSMIVHYRRSLRLRPFLVERFHHGRCFAGMRIAELTRTGRLLHAVGSPALPLLFCTRILRAVLPKRRHGRELRVAFPAIVLATASWALGELCGYVLGPGASCRHVR